jgi:hypothetical protein
MFFCNKNAIKKKMFSILSLIFLLDMWRQGQKNEQFCISVWPETQLQIFQNMFHRQITSCIALFNDIWHTLKKIIVCLHCFLHKWLTAIFIYPHPVKITPKIYQYGKYSWRCSILQNPPFRNIANTQCKLRHFQKWTIKCLSYV